MEYLTFIPAKFYHVTFRLSCSLSLFFFIVLKISYGLTASSSENFCHLSFDKNDIYVLI